MASPTLLARARRSLRYRGARRTLGVGWALARYRLRHGLGAPRPHAFDLEFGTDTVSLTGAATLAGDAEHGNAHEPIDTVDFADLMADLATAVPGLDLRRFTFIDFGSGQGRALMLAGEYPLARIIGIEHGLELHQLAERNLAHYRNPRQRCRDVRSLWADAATWELPPAPSLFYFCEPFRAPMLAHMAARLSASLAAAPRPAYVLYVGEQRQAWDERVWEPLAVRYWTCVYRKREPA